MLNSKLILEQHKGSCLLCEGLLSHKSPNHKVFVVLPSEDQSFSGKFMSICCDNMRGRKGLVVIW